jgi:signal transduction histidine kinase
VRRVRTSRALELARWGALLLCISTGLVALTEDVQPTSLRQLLPPWLLLCLAVAYGVLLFHLIRPPGRPTPERKGLLAILMALSIPLDLESIAALNLFALPHVVPVGKRKRWFFGQAAILGLQVLTTWTNWLDPTVRHQLAQLAHSEPLELAVPLVFGVLQLAAWQGFAFLTGSFLVQLDADRRTLALANAELRGAQTMLAEAVRLEERLRISRELHDSTGHYLTSLGMQLEVLERTAGAASHPALERARLLVRLLLAEVRDAAAARRRETSTALPLALEQLARGVEGMHVDLELAQDLPPTAPGTTHALYRCAQEALTNALRHSRASRFQLSLRRVQNRLELNARDNGLGRSEVALGTGLTGMTERIAELGGELTISTQPGNGFAIAISVPVATGGR